MTILIRVGKRLKLSTWRWIYPVYCVDHTGHDDLIAFFGMQAGWKTDWRLHPIELCDGGTHMGCSPAAWSYQVPATGLAAKEQAVKFLTDEENRGNFLTRRQLIECKGQTLKCKRDALAMILGANIKMHAAKLEHHRVLQELLFSTSTVGQRCVIHELIGETQTAIARHAHDVEHARVQLEKAVDDVLLYTADSALRSTDSASVSEVPEGTK